MTTVELLKAARAKIEQGWCQGTMAKEQRGRMRGPKESYSCSWCVLGALAAASTLEELNPYRTARTLMEAVVAPSLSAWNDAPGRTQAEVLAAFDKAIELAEGETK